MMVQPSKPIYRDEGYGITSMSIEFAKKNLYHIGNVKEIFVYSENQPEMTEHSLSHEPHSHMVERAWTFRAVGEDGELWLSGCNCGYSGEGSHGTWKVIRFITDQYNAKHYSQYGAYPPRVLCPDFPNTPIPSSKSIRWTIYNGFGGIME